MGKAARNRRFRKQAYILDPVGNHVRSIARALRRHGRMPLPKGKDQR
jgi:hypothetical protein